jgi:hypothetical protein
MSAFFTDFDFTSFWDNSDYAKKEYVGGAVSSAMRRAVEGEIGYSLPESYLELLSFQNGGTPRSTNHRAAGRTSWAHDHIAITGIYGIDPKRPSSLLGEFGSKFWISEWGYPDIGIYFADCPSAGHDMLCMDFTTCGPRGEPRIVHVDQEFDYKVTFVAASFDALVRGLEPANAFDVED